MTVEQWLGKDNTLGIDIWNKKYRYNNESFDEWLDRVSGGDSDLRQLILEKKFLFGGRILSNRGLDKLGEKVTLSNCYVVEPPEDNIESIFDCAKKLARTYSYGGGCGVDISKLAPKGARVTNTAKETSGSVSFMDLYSLVTGLIGQNGRRGALMISIACDHPDLEEFIEIKSDLDKVTKANISIRITDKFMLAVKMRKPFVLSFTREETGETIRKEIDAYSVFHKLCEMNWDYAEPGMLFWDRIENWNLLSADKEFSYAGTNPCAEEPLPAGGSCLLGSINLSEFVTENKTFNFTDFKKTVDIAVRALNIVLDEGLPLHPLKEQRESVRDWRQIGLGIFGLADLLIKIGIKYGSPESIDLCDMIGHAMAYQAIMTSNSIAIEVGSYPKYKPDAVKQSPFFTEHIDELYRENISEIGLCNSQLLTIAPTGSLSSMLGVSGGIEPVYANYYTRKTESLHGHDEYYKVYTPIVKKYIDEYGLKDDSELPDFFVTAQTLNYKERIDMQSIWQRHIDASISSTVNVPNNFTVKDTEDLYLYAWEKGLKGVTIFRDGCKRTGILTTDNKKKETKENNSDSNVPITLQRGMIIKADDNCIGKKRTLQTGCGTLHCEAFFDPDTGDLLETYLSKGSKGGCLNSLTGLSRLISLSARAGVDIYSIVDQLKSSGTCPSYAVRTATKHDTSIGSSCPVAVGNALLNMYKELQGELFEDVDEKPIKNKETIKRGKRLGIKPVDKSQIVPCPECGSPLVFEGGCNSCKNCGFSKCD
ncbi:adenosylcobalamin-dependent ribonucleoside-diphosphate reductase [Blautia hansenii]|uniref:Vitamin B12-dependent ribonucleotide reductase n=1 Tax=Blautia hansenii DSM 20583 TaxID=537007 RepID=C9L7Y1_BLAHA|nr:adenosylcobalamin-dependent ribonucleoside-diphosphate reductase [Blautia hansenii]ASM69719.1 ribonucleoside-diphosphate reductase, adenosylcobalamin-dependent [Blautia hansenii DSM 20583]EEX21876.1 ribonucleoside-diphosphate reductase, adenosylcobalamin-dependent [Blautia hansenii DSM 20583]UWO09467.1 adenosylcobalamin-dependent ribonucleoside-diphosphate reductase [Blautia hansenii DSM 20583]